MPVIHQNYARYFAYPMLIVFNLIEIVRQQKKANLTARLSLIVDAVTNAEFTFPCSAESAFLSLRFY